jgi:hypothetical protein
VAQDLSHIVFRERTYLSSYQRERGALGQFVLHSLLLVPLLCRAAFFRAAHTGQPLTGQPLTGQPLIGQPLAAKRATTK